ncbi:hypothetical protein INT08_11025 [Prosthecochloris sp. N3]|uniref:Uncharacterized protein n=1 Tax=Prosthecochloris ethylica TaxID=2743976 RepID=A0ABR9XUV5_9CHLB|nr:DUF6880 family protein [Prosthecochloris ethylica]MBF0587441.1 hypothetical protein [Prosthecochloris ethylica]MBF0637693.1 hypothetical protein [Prosthecochloris ethylica]NUK48656.1 hypothetical protein [Prosthecochloris ethylica]
MQNTTKQQLIDLGPETLADALLSIAAANDDAAMLVQRLTSTGEECIKRYKAKLSGLKRARKFIHLRESSRMEQQLLAILDELQSANPTPCTGAELAGAFLQTDTATLGRADDSSGIIGDIYRITASELFITYAEQCPDKQFIVKLLLKLIKHDSFSIRTSLLDYADRMLQSDTLLHQLLQTLQAAPPTTGNSTDSLHHNIIIASLARQLRDPELFEQTLRQRFDTGKLGTASLIDAAEVWLECARPDIALSRLQDIPDNESFMREEKNKLLIAIHGKLGNRSEQARITWELFQEHRTYSRLIDHLEYADPTKANAIIDNEAKQLCNAPDFATHNARFLLDAERPEAAERYIITHREQINGDYYPSLVSLAKDLEQLQLNLAATLIYRALLDSILRRARSTIYSHGVRYLKKLDTLAPLINQWQDVEPHTAYKEQLHTKHKRKISFWSRYNR